MKSEICDWLKRDKERERDAEGIDSPTPQKTQDKPRIGTETQYKNTKKTAKRPGKPAVKP